MIIGIISDTHDNKTSIEKAVNKFNEYDVKTVIHAGDHIAPFTVRWMSKLNSNVVGVAGNNDGDRRLLRKLYEGYGWKFEDLIAEVVIDGVKIAVTHGTYEAIVNALIYSGRYDVVIYGHTHRYRIERVGDTLVINPGEACGYLTGLESIVLLDTRDMKARLLTL